MALIIKTSFESINFERNGTLSEKSPWGEKIDYSEE